MGILVECPHCKNRLSPKRQSCKCGAHVKKMGGKSYWIEYYDDTGRRRRERIGPSKPAAEQRLREVLKARTEERHIEKDAAAKLSLGELIKWYKKLPEVLAKRSFKRDEKSIKRLTEYFDEHMKIKALTAGRVDGYREARLKSSSSRCPDQNIKPATVNREVACLKTILSRAVRHKIIGENPLARYEMLPEDNVRESDLDEEGFEKLLEPCPVHLRTIVTVAFYMGMRKSEILYLTWSEVDLKTGLIRLAGTRTKNKTARSIPIHPRVRELLQGLPRGLHTDRVFLHGGKPVKEFKNAFTAACVRAGLKDFTFHDLRHCAVNNLRLAGNDFFRIMAISGHKTMSVFKRYNKVNEKELQEVKWPEKTRTVDTNMDTTAKAE